MNPPHTFDRTYEGLKQINRRKQAEIAADF